MSNSATAEFDWPGREGCRSFVALPSFRRHVGAAGCTIVSNQETVPIGTIHLSAPRQLRNWGEKPNDTPFPRLFRCNLDHHRDSALVALTVHRGWHPCRASRAASGRKTARAASARPTPGPRHPCSERASPATPAGRKRSTHPSRWSRNGSANLAATTRHPTRGGANPTQSATACGSARDRADPA
jgi:hypothetical protein